MAPAKVHATRAAKLAGRVLRRAPEHARAAAPVLLDALAHEAREVQGAVLDVLERHAKALGEDERARLASVAPTLDPALRPRAAALSGEQQPAAAAAAKPRGDVDEAGRAVVVPGRREHDFAAPRLGPTTCSFRSPTSTSCSIGPRRRSSAATIPMRSSSSSTPSAGCATCGRIRRARRR